MPKIGEGMVGDMASLGVEELRAANAGQMAMDAPPIEMPQTPAMDAPQMSYEQALANAAAQAPEVEVSQSIER